MSECDHTLIDGIGWCLAHIGIVDECHSSAPRCDMADDLPCQVVDVYYDAAEQPQLVEAVTDE